MNPVSVTTDGVGRPTRVEPNQPITAVLSHHREWIGILDGEPERDIWIVETPQGIAELHCLRATGEDDKPGDWILHRWLD